MPETSIPVKIESYGNSSIGSVFIHTYTFSEKIKKTIFVSIIGILLTIFSVIIPIAHFILVPLGLIATPIVAILTFRRTQNIVGGEALCPKCSAKINFQKRAVKWPLEETCSGCSRPMTITQEV